MIMDLLTKVYKILGRTNFEVERSLNCLLIMAQGHQYASIKFTQV